MMHLFLRVFPGTGFTKKRRTKEVREKREDSFKEKPPDHNLHYFTDLASRNTKSVPQVSYSLTNFVLKDSEELLVNLLELNESENYTATSLYLKTKIVKEFDTTRTEGLTSLSFYKEPIIHLFLVQVAEIISGIKEINPKEVPPEKRMMFRQAQRKEISPPKTEVIKWIQATKQRSHAPDQSRGVIVSYLLKGRPPEAQQQPQLSTNRNCLQGKSLNSHIIHETNLSYLCADKQVLRTKLFEEGGYDTRSWTSSTMEQNMIVASTEVHQTEAMLEHVAEVAQVKELAYGRGAKAYKWVVTICTLFPYPWFYPNGFSRKGFNEANWFTCLNPIQSSNGPDGDMRSLIESFRPNQDDPSNKSNCFGNSTHQRIVPKWNQLKPSSYDEVIIFTSWVNRSSPDLDIGALNGGFRPNQKEFSYKPSWPAILTQPGRLSNWNHTKPGYDAKVIQVVRQRTLSLPYMEPSEFRRLQTYLWRPGLNENHLEAVRDVLSCTITQRIRRILPHFKFPYLYPRAFNTFGALTLHRPSCPSYCELGSLYHDQNIPEKLTYPLKPSRYKETSLSTLFFLICSLLPKD